MPLNYDFKERVFYTGPIFFQQTSFNILIGINSNEMMLCIVGFMEMVETNQTKPDETDLKQIKRLKYLFELLLKYNVNSTNENLTSIIESVKVSLKAINHILELEEQRGNHDRLKKQIFSLSSGAVINNLKKYNEPVYEN